MAYTVLPSSLRSASTLRPSVPPLMRTSCISTWTPGVVVAALVAVTTARSTGRSFGRGSRAYSMAGLSTSTRETLIRVSFGCETSLPATATVPFEMIRS